MIYFPFVEYIERLLTWLKTKKEITRAEHYLFPIYTSFIVVGFLLLVGYLECPLVSFAQNRIYGLLLLLISGGMAIFLFGMSGKKNKKDDNK